MNRADPITLDIIQNALQAISDEMFAVMRKTAMSAIIYEVLDMGTAITDGEGQLATSGAGIPSFVGALDKGVQAILRYHPVATIEPGDIFATNDPFYGGITHLNDVILAMPVFSQGQLVAWTVNMAHWNDIGGMVPGSMSTQAREVFQEGLRLPAIKLVSAGQPVKPVLAILKANSRLPAYLQGDLWAGVAAVRIGERRLQEILQRYGTDTFKAALVDFLTTGEQISRRALSRLPEGAYTLEEEQDDGSTYRVAVKVTPDQFQVDLRDNPAQVAGPHNVSREGAVVAVQMVFKALTDPERRANAGTFRPLEVLTRPGTVFHMTEPAASGFYFEVRMRLADLIWRCLAQAMGAGTLPSGHFASVCTTVVSGPHPETGRHFTVVEPQIGGWGALPGRDGNHAMFSCFHGETYNCPAEVAETRYGLYVDQLTLNDEPGGEGEFQGGKGIVLDYRVRSDQTTLTCGFSRSRLAVWGQQGGRLGSRNRVEILRRDGSREEYAIATGIPLSAGDVIRIRTANGGGYGPPANRLPSLIERDLRNGYTSAEQAREVYAFGEIG